MNARLEQHPQVEKGGVWGGLAACTVRAWVRAYAGITSMLGHACEREEVWECVHLRGACAIQLSSFTCGERVTSLETLSAVAATAMPAHCTTGKCTTPQVCGTVHTAHCGSPGRGPVSYTGRETQTPACMVISKGLMGKLVGWRKGWGRWGAARASQ
jgi:hypothetical protein